MSEVKGNDAVVEACRLLSSDEPIETRDVAKAVGLSAAYFQRCFKRQLGVTPQQYRRRVLAERGRDTIAAGSSVTESIYEAGYSSSSRFYEGVGRELGMKPSAARAGGAGETISYATAACSLGRVLVAWTRRGVCKVGFEDADEPLVRELGKQFPSATLRRAAEHRWVEALVDAVEHGASVHLPLDVRGTAFQERVWQVLRAIPAGQTTTYSDIAAVLGEPAAARAVARACATNEVAVAVPCHRVIAKDGSLAGYRWGIERKRELLRRERETGRTLVEKP